MKHLYRGLLSSLLSVIVSTAMLAAEKVTHTVKRGETLESIASLYHISPEQLAETNTLAKKKLFVGMTLVIPAPETSTTPSKTQGESQSAGKPTPNESSSRPDSSQSPVRTITETPECNYYFITAGFPFNDFMKCGTVEMESNISGPTWNNLGVYMSLGLNVRWDPKFDVTASTISLGPSYMIHFDNETHLLIPVAAMAAITFQTKEDEDTGKKKEKTKVAWACKVAPKFIYKRFGLSIFGGFAGGDPEFGVSFSIALSL